MGNVFLKYIYENSDNGALILEFTTTAANQTIKVPITSLTNVSIDWGDGNTQSGINTNLPTHQYVAKGVYNVSITGGVKIINSYLITVTERTYLTNIINWGGSSIGLTDMYRAFSTIKIINIPPVTNSFIKVTTFANTFQYCNLLTNIPDGLFDNCPLVTNFTSVFDNCLAVTSIPNGLFDNCSLVTNFSSAFYNCKGLTSIPSIPCSNVIEATNNMFYNCENLVNFGGLLDINVSYSLSDSIRLSIDSIMNAINGLRDRSTTTSQILTLGFNNRAKLTPEQIAVATAKNWTIA